MYMNHEFNKVKFTVITVIFRLDFVLGRSGLENTGTQRSNFYLPKIFSIISVPSLLTLLHHLFP